MAAVAGEGNGEIENAMTPDTLYKLAPPLIALQFAAFGWRVNREINLTGDRRALWIPIPDVLNIMGLFATVVCLIVLPIARDSHFWLSRMVLGAGYVFIAFHPFTMAAHYRLWSREARDKYVTDGRGNSYATGEELASSSLSIVLAVLVAAYIGTH
ncbi:hypothetical protein [Tunturiibacter lichenicola]|uniref:hypothetical protein n=1 Tax=Tunturiibacter lichenicola TaxID=2051959 RepID=UPI0021B15C98|nr:hypothetical protein [Edaphobacter lichenicola]